MFYDAWRRMPDFKDRKGWKDGRACSCSNYLPGVQLQPGTRNPTLPSLYIVPYPQATGRLSSLRLQFPPTYKLTRPGELTQSSTPGLSIPYNFTHTQHTHTPVDTQNGAGVRQHARGTRGDHTVKWIGAFFLYSCSGCPSIVTLIWGHRHVLPPALFLLPCSLSSPPHLCYHLVCLYIHLAELSPSQFKLY